MLRKFRPYPILSDFDHNSPIISRSEKDTTKPDCTKKFSFRNIIRYTCEHLVYGYVTPDNLQMNDKTIIPYEIKQLCFNYFIGNFPSSIQLSHLNEKAKDELIQSSYNFLCSGTIKQSGLKVLLPHFIRLAQTYANTQPRGYISYLLSLTEITDFFDILNTQLISIDEPIDCSKDERTIYIDVMIPTVDTLKQEYKKYGAIETINIIAPANAPRMFAFITFESKHAVNRYIIDSKQADYKQIMIDMSWTVADNNSIKLMYRLISQHDAFYDVYKRRVNKKEFQRSIGYTDTFSALHRDSFKSFMQREQFGMKSLRKLLVPLVFKQHTIINDEYLNNTQLLIYHDPPTVYRREIKWLWLQKEIQHGLSNVQLHKTFLQTIIKDVFSKLQTLAPHPSIIPIKLIAFEILYLLIETIKLDISYEIRNFEKFVLFVVTESLRSNRISKHGIIAWKIINMEIDKMSKNNKYKYFHNWLSFIESKTGLFRDNMVNNIRRLKQKKKENIKCVENSCSNSDGTMVSKNVMYDSAKIQLELATAVWFKVHKITKFSNNDFQKFNKFYRKLEKTEMLKPMLQDLSN